MPKEDLLNKHAQKINAAITELRLEVDTRMLFAALLAHAAIIGETLLAAKLQTPQQVIDIFAAACADATVERKNAQVPSIAYINGDEDKGKPN